jgi:hypothetical protein
MVRIEMERPSLPDVRIVGGADSRHDPMRSARSIEQRLMSEVLGDIDGEERSALRVGVAREGAQSLRAETEHHPRFAVSVQGFEESRRERYCEAVFRIDQF